MENILIYYLFPNITHVSVNIIFKTHYMLIVEYITLRQGRPLQVRGSMQDLGARPL